VVRTVGVVNDNHQLCSTPEWAERLQTLILPRLARDVDLGDVMLEVGPGPGAATDWLTPRVDHLVAVEADPDAAARLSARYAAVPGVEVRVGDATALDLPDASCASAGSFTMLHHVPTVALQDRLLAEVLRVLRPGGVLIGSDSVPSDGLHRFHDGDTYNPVEPGTLLTRLRTLGFERITISTEVSLTFAAHRPPAR
jgi:SAM-dependent methyltransferase